MPKYDKDFIILGSKINKDGSLTPLLKGRVDTAIEFANKQYEKTKRKIIYIPSGGKGYDEVVAEAVAIKNYLLEKGIKKIK
ncbi:MAG: YdcF family protein [Bacilli bacterium]|nr:YdcF family protein [Bacilli bacterium]